MDSVLMNLRHWQQQRASALQVILDDNITEVKDSKQNKEDSDDEDIDNSIISILPHKADTKAVNLFNNIYI
jgi:hypothetical protein